MKKIGFKILKYTVGLLALKVFDLCFSFFENSIEKYYEYKEIRKIISKINKKHKRIVIFLKKK